MPTLVNLIDAATIAVLAHVAQTLFEKGQVFEAYGRWLKRIEWKWPRTQKMLGGCQRCFTGQMALWIGALALGYNPFRLALFIAVSIFFSDLIQRYAGSTGKV